MQKKYCADFGPPPPKLTKSIFCGISLGGADLLNFGVLGLFPVFFWENPMEKGMQGLQAWCDAELPPFISIVRHAGRPVILGMENDS